MQALIDLIRQNQSFLVHRILHYASVHHYLKYTYTLEKAWVTAITGLSEAIISAVAEHGQIPEIEAVQDKNSSSLCAFGIDQARRHRDRGISLDLFLGLMKYYRRSFTDLVYESELGAVDKKEYLVILRQYFDLMELCFCREWCALPQEQYVEQLRDANLELMNLKNKYLTIFESMSTPVIMTDTDDRIVNMNRAARRFFQDTIQVSDDLCCNVNFTGSDNGRFEAVLPWIAEDLEEFCQQNMIERRTEKDYLSPGGQIRNMVVQMQRMLDINGKFSGTIVTLFDMTEQKCVEEQLRYMSFHDPMTGLFNRTYYEEELIRASGGRYNPFGVIACDIDGLKLVNDTLGHHAGDQLITTVGGILMGCFRKCDVAARIGGDEFSVLMANNDSSHVQEACLRLRDRVAQHNRNQPKIPVSLSVGWAVGNVFHQRDISALIKKADVQMYEEKRTNREKYNVLFAERYMQYGEELYQAATLRR